MEYEYSFKVKSLQPYIDFCKEDGYQLKSDCKQSGKELKATNKTVARIKIETQNDGTVKKIFGF